MSSRKFQKGGDLSEVNTWGQTSAPPSSYKIQIGYVEVPKTLQLDPKWLDTPYRFKSFGDANDEARRLFEGYQFRITGSNDRPHWDAPSYLRQNVDTLGEQKWYDIVGVDSTSGSTTVSPQPQLTYDQQYAMEEMSKMRTQSQAQQLANLAKERARTDSKGLNKGK